jgi:peptidoglycan/LPS O-acetylase OafA/YrhL
MQKIQRIENLDLLRGIAVLMVCICHFGGELSSRNSCVSILNAFHNYGKFGVQMFFVISGFIIPLSLYNGKFAICNYFTFIQKRIARLHIPYLLALAGSLVMMGVSPILRHTPYEENLPGIFESLFYGHIPNNNPVFWTLLIEWQYYFFIGIFYCLLVKYPKFSVGIAIPVLILISQTGWLSSIHFFSFITYFLIGNVGFFIYTKQGNVLLNRSILAGLIVFSFYSYEIAPAFVSMLTILFILFYKKALPKPLLFPGKISYAIYLIHWPIGIKFLRLPYPILQHHSVWLMLVFTLFMIIFLSYYFYKWIEVPAEKFASRFKYQQKQKALPTQLPQLAQEFIYF